MGYVLKSVPLILIENAPNQDTFMDILQDVHIPQDVVN